MDLRLGYVAALGFGLTLAGCSPKAGPPPAAPAAEEAKPAGDAALAARSGASPEAKPTSAAAPKGVFLRARLTSPARLLEAARGSLSAQSVSSSVFGELESEIKKVESWVDMNSAIEVAGYLNPRPRENPMFIYSFGVRSRESALRYLAEKGQNPVEGRGGHYYFTHQGDPCLMGPSFGQSPYRIACADSQGALDVGGEWALGGLPAEKFGSGMLSLELDPRPAVAVYGRDIRRLRSLAPVGAAALSTGDSKLDGAVKRVLLALADEVVLLSDDVAALRLDIDAKDGNLVTRVDLDFRAKASFLAQLAQRSVDKEGPAPEAFFALPASVKSAGYAYSPEDSLFADIRRGLSELSAGLARKYGAPAKSAETVGKFFELLATVRPYHISAQLPIDGPELPRREIAFYAESGDKKRLVALYETMAQLSADSKLWKGVGLEKAPLSFKRVSKPISGASGAVVYTWATEANFEADMRSKLEAMAQGAGTGGVTGYLSHLFDTFRSGYIAVRESAGMTWVISAPTLDGVSAGFKELNDQKSPRLKTLPVAAQVSEGKALSQAFVELELLLEYVRAMSAAKESSGTKRATSAPLLFKSRATGNPLRLQFEMTIPAAAAEQVMTLAKDLDLDPQAM